MSSLVSCGNQSNKSNAQTAGTVIIDTFSSPDLTMYGLKGHVRTCKTLTYPALIKNNEYAIKDGEVTSSLLVFTGQGYLKQDDIFDLTYNEQGKLIKGINIKAENMKVSVKRNKGGYITAILCEDKQAGMEHDQAYRIDYTWNKRKEMIKEKYSGWEWTSINHYKYDEKGLLHEKSSKDNFDYETEVTHTTTYLYTKFDDRGNWTERNVQVTSVTSTSDLDTGKVISNTTEKNYSVEKREITYFGE